MPRRYLAASPKANGARRARGQNHGAGKALVRFNLGNGETIILPPACCRSSPFRYGGL